MRLNIYRMGTLVKTEERPVTLPGYNSSRSSSNFNESSTKARIDFPRPTILWASGLSAGWQWYFPPSES